MREIEKWRRIQRHVGAQVDGWPGNETATRIIEYLRDEYDASCAGAAPKTPPDRVPERDEPEGDGVIVEPDPNNGAFADFPVQTQRNLFRVFGDTGNGQTTLQLPFEMRLSWNMRKRIQSFSCHAKVHDSLLGIYQDVLDHYGLQRIRELGLDRWGGCLNVRPIRGGSTWSTHSWGIAVDHWPEANWLTWDATRAEFAKPEYEPFFDIVESRGWSSLGRHADYDWMHIQAAPFE